MPRPLPIKPNSNKKIGKETVLEELVRRQFGKCYYCQMPMMFSHGAGSPRHPTIEHKKPRSSKGTDHYDNLAAACLACNSLKGSLDEAEYRLVVALRSSWGSSIPLTAKQFGEWVLDHKVRPVQDPFFAPYPFAKNDLLRDRKKGEPRLLIRTKPKKSPAWVIFPCKPYHKVRKLFFDKKGRWKYPLFSRKKTNAKTG